jgi:hypothetical protein
MRQLRKYARQHSNNIVENGENKLEYDYILISTHKNAKSSEKVKYYPPNSIKIED